MKLLLSLFCSLLYHFSYAQSVMTPKEGFFYGLSATVQNAGDKLSYKDFVASSGKTYQWGDFYASYIDKENYLKAVNDEFKRVPYLTQKFKELNEGIKNADFNKTFYYTVKTGFGTYNTDCGCFPLNGKDFLDYKPTLLDIKEVGNNKLVFDNSFARLRITSYANFDDFDYAFKIKSSEAEKFIESRKDNSGNISRQITLKVIYNLTKGQSNGISAYIHKIEFYNGTILLGFTLPKYNYYDKVNLIKIKDGTVKTFLDEKWKELNQKDSSNASGYRITNYKNGKVDKITLYLLNGILHQKIEYNYPNDRNEQFGKSVSYFENGQKKAEWEYYNGKLYGQFHSWYSNGQKEIDANYVENNFDGKYSSWYSDGYKKEEVTYINGIKEGCYYKWDKNGKCVGSTKALQGDYSTYAEYFENGKYIYNSKCPCTDSKKEVEIQAAVKMGNTTLLTIGEIFGNYNGVSESSGSTITINSDASVEYITNGATYKGNANMVKTEEKNLDNIQSQVKRKLNKDFDITGNNVAFSVTLNGKTENFQYVLLKVGNSMMLWGGGDAFFEKK